MPSHSPFLSQLAVTSPIAAIILPENKYLIQPQNRRKPLKLLDCDVRYGLIDENGVEIIPAGKYELAYGGGEYEFILVFTDIKINEYGGRDYYKFAILDRSGNEIIPLGKYDACRIEMDGLLASCDGYIPLMKDGKWGFVDRNDKIVEQLAKIEERKQKEKSKD